MNPHNTTSTKHNPFEPKPLPRGVMAAARRLADDLAQSIGPRFPSVASSEITSEALAAFALWLARGPHRMDGRGRFRKWSMNRAALTLWKRIRTAKGTAHRGHLTRPPASMLRTMQKACERHARGLAKRPHPALVFTPRALAPTVPFPSPVLSVPVLPAALVEIGNRFAAQVTERHVMLTGTRAVGAAYRQSLAEAVRSALIQWLAARRRRNVVGSLLARAARAEAASVSVFTFWPASLHRDARKACQLVKVPAKIVQHVQLLA